MKNNTLIHLLRRSAVILFVSLFFADSLRAEQFKIGALLNLTGHGSRWGENARRGIELAVEELKAAGVPVRIIFEDTRSGNLAACAAAAQKLVHVDEVDLIITQWSGDTEIAYPIAANKSIPVITVSAGAPGLTRGRPLLFSVWGDDTALVNQIILTVESKRLRRLALLATQDPYFLPLAEILQQKLQAKGIQLAFQREILPDETQLRNEAVCVKAAHADTVISFLYLSQQADLVKNLRALKISPKVFGVLGSDDDTFFALAGDAANGVLMPTYQPGAASFITQFEARFGEAPWLSADTAYDAVKLALLASDSGKLTGVELAEAMRSIKKFSGASGELSFSSDGMRVGRVTRVLRLEFGR